MATSIAREEQCGNTSQGKRQACDWSVRRGSVRSVIGL